VVLHFQVAHCQTQVSTDLTLEGVNVDARAVNIAYTIPFDGYVEVQVYNTKGKRIGIVASVKTPGNQVTRLNRAFMTPGEQYRYRLVYKGREYHGEFRNGEPVLAVEEDTPSGRGQEPRRSAYDFDLSDFGLDEPFTNE
jgi:hypothetical protein